MIPLGDHHLRYTTSMHQGFTKPGLTRSNYVTGSGRMVVYEQIYLFARHITDLSCHLAPEVHPNMQRQPRTMKVPSVSRMTPCHVMVMS